MAPSHSHQGMKNSRFIFHLIAGILVILWASPINALAESLEAMVGRSDAIVISVPSKKSSFWDGNLIKTRAILKVQQVVSGSIKRKEIPIIYDGGNVGSIGLKVSRGVRLPIGQKSLLFLVKSGNHFNVLDQINGVFFIFPSREGEVVVSAKEIPYTPGISIKSSLNSVSKVEGIPLKTFLSAIQNLKDRKEKP